MTDQSKNSSDLSTVLQTSKQDGAISDVSSTGASEEEIGTNPIGDIIADLQHGYLKMLTQMAYATSNLESWLSSNASQASPSERQQLLSALGACLKQSAFTTGLLHQSVERLRSPIMIVNKL